MTNEEAKAALLLDYCGQCEYENGSKEYFCEEENCEIYLAIKAPKSIFRNRLPVNIYRGELICGAGDARLAVLSHQMFLTSARNADRP